MRLDVKSNALRVSSKRCAKERRHVEAQGCFSDRELAAKEAALVDYDRRMQILGLERDRLQFIHQTGGSRDV